MKYGAEQSGNIGSWWLGRLEMTSGILKESYANLTGNEELLNEAYGDIISGYIQAQESIDDIQTEYTEFSEKSWGERLEDDITFGNDVASGFIDVALGVEQVYAPDYSYFKDTEQKVNKSIVQEFSPPQVDLTDAYLIGAVGGMISPGGKDKKVRKFYGALSDTIETAYKKNKDKIEEVIDYFKKNGSERRGFNDSHKFNNYEGLPELDENGNKINYTIIDIDPIPAEGARNADRVIYGIDGSIHYTDNHYVTIIEIND